MARYHGVMVGKGIQHLLNGFCQLWCVASREVGATNAPLKQNVPTDYPRSGIVYEDHMPRSMSRGVLDVERHLTENEGLSIL